MCCCASRRETIPSAVHKGSTADDDMTRARVCGVCPCLPPCTSSARNCRVVRNSKRTETRHRRRWRFLYGQYALHGSARNECSPSSRATQKEEFSGPDPVESFQVVQDGGDNGVVLALLARWNAGAIGNAEPALVLLLLARHRHPHKPQQTYHYRIANDW